ncbi:LysM peptidoglycan-binding domain-containing protein [Gracilibacillus sp. YIM 98692]|uniref:LysM peptidoglycan-binding domain-containing protein n=1 Tax=Gracilibacillus sp. YIM 98692 TaxID=2663532 RepID=UPI0013D16037|nr:LysM peptidoglycan-binding domain-containing protein [Gracilibacillus sp. YIM 98692]
MKEKQVLPLDQDFVSTSDTQINKGKLPPRSAVHQRKKNKRKISFPFIRILLFLFILMTVLIMTFKIWGKEYLNSVGITSAEQETIGQQVRIKQSSNVTVGQQSMSTLYHTVKKEDTLFSIAEQYYSDPTKANWIVEANQLENRTLVVGMELIIPEDQKQMNETFMDTIE